VSSLLNARRRSSYLPVSIQQRHLCCRRRKQYDETSSAFNSFSAILASNQLDVRALRVFRWCHVRCKGQMVVNESNFDDGLDSSLIILGFYCMHQL
jgi:hypothetical protein